MSTQNSVILRIMHLADERFGFRFAMQLHEALSNNAPEARDMLRKVLAR